MAGIDDPDEHTGRGPADELAALREELLAAKRQALVGQIAAGVAHDFSNALTAVLGYSEMLLGDVEPGHPWRADLEEIYASGQRAAQLARRLLAFNRQVGSSPQPLSWARLIEESGPVLRPLLSERIQLSVQCDPGSAEVDVLVDKGEACELLFTLGWLSRTTAASGGTCRLGVSGPLAGTVALSRPGMRQQLRCEMLSAADACFPPQSSAVLDSGFRHLDAVARRAGGAFEATRTQSSWEVVITFAVESASLIEEAPVTAGTRPARLTALLAEDEELLRDVVGRMLERSGITVLEARSGEEALATLERDAPHLDLLITDIIMSGMSGTDLAARVEERRPGVRVLYVSGYLDAMAVDLARTGGRSWFLPKPFTRDQLLGAIDRLMATEN